MPETLAAHSMEAAKHSRGTPRPQHGQALANNGPRDLWRNLVCLRRVLIDSSPTLLSQGRLNRQRRHQSRQHQLTESERPGSQEKNPPAPSSSRAQESTSSAHSSGSYLSDRSTKRRLGSEPGGEALPISKRAEKVNEGSSLTYKLVLVQQPTIGSAFEDNLLGRLGLAPPLIVELHVFRDGKISDATAELPFLICQCSLLDEQGRVADMVDQRVGSASQQSQEATTAPAAVSAVPRRGRSVRNKISHRGGLADGTATPLSLDSTEASTSSASEDTLTPGTGEPSATQLSGRDSPQIVRMLYGTLAAGPQQYISPNADEEEKAYFFFPELSIRTPGRFKIRCTLLRLSLPGMEAAEVGSLASVETQTFEVVKRTDYSAPYITDISRHFARQGVPLLLPPGVSAE